MGSKAKKSCMEVVEEVRCDTDGILLGDLKGWTHVRFMLCVFSALRPAIPRPNLQNSLALPLADQGSSRLLLLLLCSEHCPLTTGTEPVKRGTSRCSLSFVSVCVAAYGD